MTTNKDIGDIAHLISSLEETFHKQRRSLWNSRTKLFTRISHPSKLYDGESYNVDLAQARFEGTMNGEVVSFGPAQLIGTFLPSNNSWLWGWNNPSIADAGHREIYTQLQQFAVFREIILYEQFKCSAHFADDLATFVAASLGYLGAYPAPTGQAIAYLALKLTGSEGRGFEWKDNYWCCLCGGWPEQVEKIIAGPENLYLCSACIDSYMDIAQEMSKHADTQQNSQMNLPGCLMCGDEEQKRIFSDFSSLCIDCVNTAYTALVQQGLRQRRE